MDNFGCTFQFVDPPVKIIKGTIETPTGFSATQIAVQSFYIGHLDQREGEGEAKGQARPLEPVPLHEGVQAGRDVVKEVATRSHLNEDVEL